MQALLIGMTQLDFQTQTGEKIKGTQLFYGYTEENTLGYKTDKIFIRENVKLPENLKPNDAINLFFDRKGRVESISIIKK